MRYQLYPLVLSAFALSLPQSARTIDSAMLCSLALAPGRTQTESVLLTLASSDTVLTGAGTVQPGSSGMGGAGLIYGQVFEVARFAGADSSRLANAFRRRRDMRVAIVPWSYDSMCRPIRWTSGFSWVADAAAGTFTVILRPDSLWTNGMPVFDAFHADFEPYPLGRAHRPERTAPQFRTTAQLNAEEYFELLMALPPHEVQQQQPDSGWQRFVEWQQANHALAQLWPANEAALNLASSVSWIKSRQALRKIEPVIAGTYRMTVRFGAAAEKTFYVRTRARALDEWKTVGARTVQDPLSEPPVPEAYNMMASGAPFLEQLSTDCSRDRAMSREGYMYVIDPPATAGVRRRQWQGWIEASFITRQFPGDSELEAFRRQEFTEWSARYRTATEREAPARFWLDNAGTLRVEQTMRLQDGRILTLRGERLSTDVIACEY